MHDMTAAREDARQADGMFGAQSKHESQVQLYTGTVPDFTGIFPDPHRAARAKKTYADIKTFLNGDDYLTHSLDLDDEGMFDWSGPDTVHYASTTRCCGA